jgi:hypothetical protein
MAYSMRTNPLGYLLPFTALAAKETRAPNSWVRLRVNGRPRNYCGRILRTAERPAARRADDTTVPRHRKGELRADAGIDATAKALIGTLLLEVLTRDAIGNQRGTRSDGLLDAILKGASGIG